MRFSLERANPTVFVVFFLSVYLLNFFVYFLSKWAISASVNWRKQTKKKSEGVAWINLTSSFPEKKKKKQRYRWLIQQTTSENVANVFFHATLEKFGKCNNHRSFWACVWEKLWQGIHLIIAMSSLSKSSVFKMFPVQTKTQVGVFSLI